MIDFHFRLLSLTDVLLCCVVLFATYSIYSLVLFWLRPYQSPLVKLRGPPTKHWYFGFLDPAEAKSIQMAQLLSQATEKYGNAYTLIGPGRHRTLVLSDQAAINYVMLSASRIYIKTPNAVRLLSTFFGKGLLAVDGNVHKLHRKVAFPAFTNRAVEDMSPIFYQSAQHLVSRWQRKFSTIQDHGKGLPLNAFHEFTLAAFDIIGKAGFNYDFKALEEQETEMGRAFDVIFNKLISKSLYAVLRRESPFVQALGMLFVKEQKDLDEARSVVSSTSLELVKNAQAKVRQEAGNQEIKVQDVEGKDLLTTMIRSNMGVDAKVSEKMSEKDLIEMVPTFLAAGHETTSSALSWAAYALTRIEETSGGNAGMTKQHRLRKELLAPENDGWQTDFKKVDSLPYLDAVVKEVLRLHSPVRLTLRMATKDDTIPLSNPIQLRDGSQTQSIHIGKGDNITIQLWQTNIDPNVWGKDALIFRPERWLSKDHEYCDGGLTSQAQKNHGWSKLSTFTVGPRNCIGMHMAVGEMKVVLATILSSFEMRPIELPGEETVEIDWKNLVVARPFRKANPETLDMPCRLHRLAS